MAQSKTGKGAMTGTGGDMLRSTGMPNARPKINPKASARMTGSGMKRGMGGMTSRSKCK